MTSPGLRKTQQLFWRLITAPEGAGEGARELYRMGILGSTDLSFLVPPDATLDPAARIDIYADMYFYRLRDCLAEDFPALAARVGKPRFHNLVTDYLLRHPPTHFSLRELGRALPDFLRSHPLATESPALAGLADLEWARVDVFDDLDAQPLSRDALLEASVSTSFAVRLIPSLRLLRLDPRVLPLWKILAQGDAAPEAAEAAPVRLRGVLVWRQEFAVWHRSLAEDEEACLRALSGDGATLATLGAQVARSQPRDAPPQRAVERLAALLDRWTRDRVLRASAGEHNPLVGPRGLEPRTDGLKDRQDTE